MMPHTAKRQRLAASAITGVSTALALWGHYHGAAELPHTAACLTVILPMAGLSWALRSALPATAALVLVAFIQWSL